MDLRAQLAVVRSWFLVILVAAVLAGAATYYVSVSGTLPTVYEARAKVRVTQDTTNPNVDLLQAARNLSLTYADKAESSEFFQAVMDRVGIVSTPIQVFRQKVSVSVDADLPIIELAATDGQPTTAVAIAKAMADELVAASVEISGGPAAEDPFLQEDLTAIERALADTRARIAILQADRNRSVADDARLKALLADVLALRQTDAALRSAPAANRLSIFDPPDLPDTPVSPRPVFNTVISVILALLVATGVAFAWEKLDDRVRTPEDVEKVTGLPTIGTVVRMPSERGRKDFYRLAALLYPRSAAAEAFRTIRTNLEFASLDRPLRTITVTSSVPGEGKSVVSGNLAVAFAQAGRRTMVIDADLRRPGLHDLFSLPNDAGLTDMVLSDVVALADVAQHTEEPNLWVVTSGPVPANPAELLGSQRMAVILQRILAEADLVILDTAPVGVVTDAALLAARSDSTVLVVSPDKSSERMVRKAREALAHVNARVMGVVLNNVSPRDAQANPYYGLYRKDKRSKPGPKPPAKAAAQTEAPVSVRSAEGEP